MGTSDRLPHLTATVLNQAFLDEAQDNLNNQLEMILDLEVNPGFNASGIARISDLNKYVGGTFYEALTNFPVITRTVGELLSPTLQLDGLRVEINSVDERFNSLLPSGALYDGWIGKTVTVKLGLRDVASTYSTIFDGQTTEEGGFSRKTNSFILVARNRFDSVNQNFPKTVLDDTTYPNIEDSNKNKTRPIIYGDWTVNVEPGSSSVPAFVVNGEDPTVNGDTSNATNIQTVVSQNTNATLETTTVYVERGELVGLIDSADITNVAGDLNAFDIKQSGSGGVTIFDGGAYSYRRGDNFYCRVKGKDLGAYDDNPVEQARDLLKDFGGLIASDFDSSWDTFRDKASPAESAISLIKSRVWISDPLPVLEYALSILEQVRLEAFVDRNQKFKISSLHLDDFEASPSFTVREWDIEEDSFKPEIDPQAKTTGFNRAKGAFRFLPNREENIGETPVFRNSAAITQVGKEITRLVSFPNLYIESDVQNQLKEILRITTSYLENIFCNLTWRSMLLDIGDFVKVNVNIDGTQFDNVPCMIREIGYDPNGLKIPVRLWSMQMLPFPGYTPGFTGTVGGSTATITEET